jgi:pyruvate dehydrogenase E2 component (dihydrolipoamide acetyltransferase)
MKNRRGPDYAEQWFRDAIEITRPPAFFLSIDADVSQAKKLIQRAAEQGLPLTYAPILIRAAALSLARNPDLNVLFAGRKKYTPSHIDIGVSVAGETFLAPVLLVEDADKKKLPELAREIRARVPEVRSADQTLIATLRRWGWLIPFSLGRKTALRVAARFSGLQRKGSGTFQVSVLSMVDQFMTPVFGTAGVLCAGRVRDAVVVVDAQPAVRPTITLTFCVDHRLFDGRAGERFLCGVRDVLEGNCLAPELEEQAEPQRDAHQHR